MLDSTRDFLETLEKVLFRCWVFGFLLLLFSATIFLLSGELVYRIQGQMFGIEPHELDLIIYCGLGFLKLVVIGLYFLPWLGIKLVLRQNRAV